MSDAPTPRDRARATHELIRAASTGDPLSVMDRDIIGHGNLRLNVPLRDPIDLRRVATILRDLANGLDVCSGLKGDARTALFAARFHIKTAAGRLLSKPTRNNR